MVSRPALTKRAGRDYGASFAFRRHPILWAAAKKPLTSGRYLLQHIDKRAKPSRNLPVSWIVQAQPWKPGAPIIKHDGKLSARNSFIRGALRNKSDPETLDRGI